MEALRAAVRYRRGLVTDRKVAQQRLHDQLNALCPGLSVPAGHGRALALETPTGLAVLACAAAFSGRPPQLRSLMCRAPVRWTAAPRSMAEAVGTCLPPPADADQRARRLTRDLDRYRRLRDDIEAIDLEVVALLAGTDGQILTTLPGVASIRAAAFAAHSLPIERFPDAESLLGNGFGPGALSVGDAQSARSYLPSGLG